MAITITEKDILNAEDYMPISMKEARARVLSILCVERVQLNSDVLPLPDMWQENRMIRNQVLMGTFAQYYLKKELKKQKVSFVADSGKTKEVELDYLMDSEQYDEWDGSHVMNQIERLKKSKKEDVVNKIYDMMYDYKKFENMLLGAIRDKVEQGNEPCGRLMAMVQIQTDPQTVEQVIEQMNKLTEEAEKLQEKK